MKTQETYKDLYAARHEPENLRPIAEMYWRLILLSGVVIIAMIVALGVWEFAAVMAAISSGTAVASAPQQAPLDRTALEGALNEYSQHSADYEYAKGATPTIPDPTK